MRRINVRVFSRRILLIALIAISGSVGFCSLAHGDALIFDDSLPGGIDITGNGFINAPLTLNGSVILTNNTYVNQSIMLPKMADITFEGTTPIFSTPYTFSTTYQFITVNAPTTPLAELILNGVPSGSGEHFTGTFIGYDDPNLPSSISVDAEATIVDSQGTYAFISGTGSDTTYFKVITDISAAPLPSASMGGLVLLGLLGMGSAARRYQTARQGK